MIVSGNNSRLVSAMRFSLPPCYFSVILSWILNSVLTGLKSDFAVICPEIPRSFLTGNAFAGCRGVCLKSVSLILFSGTHVNMHRVMFM